MKVKPDDGQNKWTSFHFPKDPLCIPGQDFKLLWLIKANTVSNRISQVFTKTALSFASAVEWNHWSKMPLFSFFDKLFDIICSAYKHKNNHKSSFQDLFNLTNLANLAPHFFSRAENCRVELHHLSLFRGKLGYDISLHATDHTTVKNPDNYLSLKVLAISFKYTVILESSSVPACLKTPRIIVDLKLNEIFIN